MKSKSLLLIVFFLLSSRAYAIDWGFLGGGLQNACDITWYCVENKENDVWVIYAIPPGYQTPVGRDIDWCTPTPPSWDADGKPYFPPGTPGIKIRQPGWTRVVECCPNITFVYWTPVPPLFATAGGMNGGQAITTTGLPPAIKPVPAPAPANKPLPGSLQ